MAKENKNRMNMSKSQNIQELEIVATSLHKRFATCEDSTQKKKLYKEFKLAQSKLVKILGKERWRMDLERMLKCSLKSDLKKLFQGE